MVWHGIKPIMPKQNSRQSSIMLIKKIDQVLPTRNLFYCSCKMVLQHHFLYIQNRNEAKDFLCLHITLCVHFLANVGLDLSWVLYKEVTRTNITRGFFFFYFAGRSTGCEPENLNELLMVDTAENCRWKCCQIGFWNEIKATNICASCKKYTVH